MGVLVGPVDIGIGEIARSRARARPVPRLRDAARRAEDAIVWELRLPRVALGALVGAMLALAGATYQGVFRNPLADPYLLGVAAGAGLGATIAISYGPIGTEGSALPLAAFVGATAAVVGTYAIGRSLGGERTTATLILAGVTVAAFLAAVQTFVQQQNAETLNEVYSWLLGGLSTAGWREVGLIAPYVVFSSAVLLLHRRTLDVLAVGDDEAAKPRPRRDAPAPRTRWLRHARDRRGRRGQRADRLRRHRRPAHRPARRAASFRVILPLSAALGAAFLVLADVFARTALAPAELPIGVVTAFVGAPFFALVLRTTRNAP